VIDERAGGAQLEHLTQTLRPPFQLGDYTLEALVTRTATSLIFIARPSAADSDECVLKLTAPAYVPILERELNLLNVCHTAELHGVVHPLGDELVRFEDIAAIALPFLAGGDLVQWIGARATRTGQLGAAPALAVAEIVGGLLRAMLQLPRPIVHGDVKPQNVLLPRPDAPLAELTLIDFDAAEALDYPSTRLAQAPREITQRLVTDVNGFGELLFMLATGREPPADAEPDPETVNVVFNALVARCITAEGGTHDYASMADSRLWADLAHANAIEKEHGRGALSRPVLAILALVLLCLLIVAMLSKVSTSG
jgi:serine/threonine protein kinase